MHLRKVIMYWKGSAPETLGCDTNSFKYYIPPIHAIEEYCEMAARYKHF